MKKITDAHCHFLTAGFLIKEVFAMAKYHFLGIEKSLPKEKQKRYPKLKEFLRLVKDYYIGVFKSSEDVYTNLRNNYQKALNDEKVRISFYPLMMDIFFMYHKPLENSNKSIINEDFMEFQDLDYIELYQNNENLKAFADEVLKEVNERTNTNIVFDDLFTGFESSSEYDEIISQIQYTPGYIDHLKELIMLEQKYKGLIFPFLAVDPRRKGIVEAIPKLVSKTGPFYGIKLYPRLGYKPEIPQLFPVYDFCNENGIPITTHCTIVGFPPEYNDKKWRYWEFSNPEFYQNLIQEYTNINFNIAHFGHGNETWRKTIAELCAKDNVFTDLSCYTNEDEINEAYIPYREQIREKLMFGSDFTVATTEGVTEVQYLKNFLAIFKSKDDFDKIAVENPKKFFAKTKSVEKTKEVK
jgi:predicted TIM-barrel fold metal-dependent hydrolase